MEDIGKSIEDERKKNWEPSVTIDTVYRAVASIKKLDKITGMIFFRLLS